MKKHALPHCNGGFLYGHQFQDKAAADYRTLDLEFCAWARAGIAAVTGDLDFSWLDLSGAEGFAMFRVLPGDMHHYERHKLDWRGIF